MTKPASGGEPSREEILRLIREHQKSIKHPPKRTDLSGMMKGISQSIEGGRTPAQIELLPDLSSMSRSELIAHYKKLTRHLGGGRKRRRK
jgi:hypothetical protein